MDPGDPLLQYDQDGDIDDDHGDGDDDIDDHHGDEDDNIDDHHGDGHGHQWLACGPRSSE